jgi:PadR family transcriptional regulator PadR
MEHRGADSAWPVAQHSRFELAPPRRFLLPALLLLLSEEPGYGYNLAKGLEDLRFGRVDRPSVYRALAQLERDGLVDSWAGTPKAGQARRVYGLTEEGQRALRAWMGVIKQERDCLDLVLRRYVATGTVDSALAEAEGGWAAVTGHPWSPVSATSRIERHRHGIPSAVPGSRRREVSSNGRDEPAVPAPSPSAPTRTRFAVVPDRSVVLIEARSTVGPITFGAVGISGTIEAEVHDGQVQPGRAPSAHLEIDVTGLRSGNGLYDAELLRRIDARRHPVVALDLRGASAVGSLDRFHVDGEVTVHGTTRPIHGTVNVCLPSPGKLVVSGEQVFDIRDFDIASPTVLMLRIYPDVLVQLQVEAEPMDAAGPA